MSEHLWEVLAAGAYGEAVGGLLVSVAGLSMGVYALKRAVAIDSWGDEMPGVSAFLAIAGGLAAFISVLDLSADGPSNAAVIFSPEYGAWLKVLEVLK